MAGRWDANCEVIFGRDLSAPRRFVRMDRIEKALRKLSDRERRWVREILEQLQGGDLQHLHIQKLRGHGDVFRARKGDVRVIYRRSDGSTFILAIERRSEGTYRNV